MRERLGLSQEALARDLEVSWKTIARYEGNMPPAGGGLLRLIHYAESKGLEDIAAKFRYAYVSGIGPKAIGNLDLAWEELWIAEALMEDLKSLCVSPLEQRYINKVRVLLGAVRARLVTVLPFKEVMDSDAGETAFVLDTEIIPPSPVTRSLKAIREEILGVALGPECTPGAGSKNDDTE